MTPVKTKAEKKAHPFIKWAGGKTQLLAQFEAFYPEALKSGRIKQYVEPFLGGGAVFFDVAQRYSFDEAKLFDVNPELILLYKVVQKKTAPLVEHLAKLQKDYIKLNDEKRKAFFYAQRETFNRNRSGINFEKFSEKWIERAAQQIFINKTTYNGLYRVNAKGDFNSPHGRYANPKICDAENLFACARVLRNAEIRRASFDQILPEISNGAFVYFDPPYRPISRTAYFTSYSSFAFTDDQQRKLADLFRKLDKKKCLLMLSNSDPKNEDPKDDFFDDLYKGFHIERVRAGRMINANTKKRGRINEILITNYKPA